MKKIVFSAGAVCAFFVTNELNAASVDAGIVRWPYGRIPYVDALGASDSNRRTLLENAVRHWNDKTDIEFFKFTSLTPEQKKIYGNGLRVTSQFLPDTCRFDNSFMGSSLIPPLFNEDKTPRHTSPRVLLCKLTDVFIKQWSVPSTVKDNGSVALHELGHALGLIHEHQRSDRNAFLFSGRTQSDWSVHPNSINVTNYDYLSFMHYYPWQGSSITNANSTPPWTRGALVLSLDAPSNATAAQIQSSAELRSNFPEYESRMHYRTGLSDLDVAGVNALYGRGISDLHVDSFKNLSYCNDLSYQNGACSVRNELVVRSDVANLGPWDSGKVVITHSLPIGVDLNSVVISQSDADACEKTIVDSKPTVVCYKNSMKPIDLLRTEFRLIQPLVQDMAYSVSVSVTGSRDDMPHNNRMSFVAK